jgi:hypothetical protein
LLRLINTGLGRTGTTSLKAALERLGFGPGYHMFDVVSSDERLAQWEKVVCDGQPPDWEAIFEGYASAVDGPCAIYYRQIMEAYPEAKLILTVRDADRWYQSTYDTLYQFALKIRESSPAADSMPARVYRLTSTLIWDGLFGGRFSDKEYALEVFHRHNQDVVDQVDPDNLLVYDVKQGWEPLCAFLGLEAPSEDFPRLNDAESMRKVIGQVSSGVSPVFPDRTHQAA